LSVFRIKTNRPKPIKIAIFSQFDGKIPSPEFLDRHLFGGIVTPSGKIGMKIFLSKSGFFSFVPSIQIF